MQTPLPHNRPGSLRFPQQKVLSDNKPHSHDLLHILLEVVYSVRPPFTGYLKFASEESSLLFLFFYKGAPYAASIYADSKPAFHSIQDFAREVVKSAQKPLAVTLCETDSILLKGMLLFLQKEPAIKAPTSLVDFENIVRQIGESGENAMIALRRDNDINFYYFKDGKGALVHYADPTFERPQGMTIDEEMLLYAFQPGEEVQAYIFRDMFTATSADASQLDMESLYRLLTVGYLKDRRSGGARTAPAAGEQPGARRGDDILMALDTGVRGAGTAGTTPAREPKPANVVLSVESGPRQGDRLTITLPCTIGRKACDLILDDRLVSRRHAELKIVGNDLVIEDLASTNGTKVNGRKVARSRLVPDDLVTIGPINLRINPASSASGPDLTPSSH